MDDCLLRRDTTVFVRTGFSLLRLQLAVSQNASKVGEGVRFFTRGLRLLGSDVANGGQLFYRAALGRPPRSIHSETLQYLSMHFASTVHPRFHNTLFAYTRKQLTFIDRSR